MTPLEEPLDNLPEWPQQDLVAVLAHSGGGSLGQGGHWVAFRRVQGVWWCLDSTVNNIMQVNPFDQQHRLKIELLMFKE